MWAKALLSCVAFPLAVNAAVMSISVLEKCKMLALLSVPSPHTHTSLNYKK